jgi:type II secretory pathway pseudopilin PulG
MFEKSPLRVCKADVQIGRTASRAGVKTGAVGSNAFTLIELVLVMTLLTVVFGMSAPSLSKFFRGRNLGAEADRFLALTRYAQSRAVAEGMPVLIWIDAQQKRYWVEADSTYTENDPKAEHFNLADKLQIEAQNPVVLAPSGQWWQLMSNGSSLQSILWGQGQDNSRGTLPKIRFTPDGQISATSPDRVAIRDTGNNNATLWIVRSTIRQTYEIQTDIQQRASR